MRRIAAIIATAVIGAGALVAGCGGDAATTDGGTVSAATASGTGTGTASAGNATQAVSRAYAALRATSYVSTGTTTQRIDASGVDAALRDQVERQFAGEAASLSTRTRFASPERMAITQEVGGRSQEVVLYDGEVFVSSDGTTWARVTGDAAQAFSQASAVAQIDPASLFTGLQAQGTTTVDGAPVTRYSGAVDTDSAGAAVTAALGGLGELGTAVDDAVQLRSGTVALGVDDTTGTIARQDITLEIAFDFGALARSAGQDDAGGLGTIVMTSAATERITDVGGAVTVEKPTATETVSTITELGEFLTS